MEKKQWTMQEDFIFPVEAGLPVGAAFLQVTPGYTEERTEDAVRLTGIYHIAANVVFDEGQRAEELFDSAIFIDDVDIQGEAGYFEYAVPLHIVLPPEVVTPLEVVTTAASIELDGQGSFSVVWDVECSYAEGVAQLDEYDTVVLAEELEYVEEVDDSLMTAMVDGVEIEDAEAVVAVVTPIATQASTSSNEMDEALAFIAGLEDGISTTTFRSNDVFVKNES
ncbi:hypothetical protein [Sporosarcina sp. YIM B06819]|uniref:hypothetical protein n=1 Tax=Sporosarcina sp. YIM B06819 TaxID=3081769 RepID=UPI00298D2F0B|nr:hypothetical protein [Sporosarcina sp. YIM B06819]